MRLGCRECGQSETWKWKWGKARSRKTRMTEHKTRETKTKTAIFKAPHASSMPPKNKWHDKKLKQCYYLSTGNIKAACSFKT
jgi:hypothetical protein